MGGACRVKTATLFTAGPPCTDNFQVLPFTYLDKLFQSVEQGYQALKFTDEAAVEAIRGIGKTAGETDSAHGMRSWQAGQRQRSGVRADWNAVKVCDNIHTHIKHTHT